MSDWEEVYWEDQPYDVIMRLAAEERSQTPKFDWLRSRPDKRLQTPEGQNFLDELHGVVGPDPKIDALTPWLAREWKKGRVSVHPQGGIYRGGFPDGWGDRLTRGDLGHWADWFHSKHPTRRGVDIMQLSAPQFEDKISEWDRQMQEEAENAAQKNAEGGEVVHSWPDGWTIRKLGPEHLKYEGDNMGHCVGGYGYEDQVRNGDTMIYSLRGPDHRPHATMELSPTQWADEDGQIWDSPWDAGIGADLDDPSGKKTNNPVFPVPQNADIVQIQGKGNEVPKPEYQQRIKDWFSTMPEDQRPKWDRGVGVVDNIRHLNPEAPFYVGRGYHEPDIYDQGGYGEHGDYGLPDNRDVDWKALLDSLPRYRTHGDEYIGQPSYDPDEGRLVYDYARKRGQVPQLAEAAQRFDEEQNDDFYERYMENSHHYPEEYPPYDPDEWQDDPDGEKEYDEAQDRFAKEHAGTQASSHLFSLLNPHYNDKTHTWENEPQNQPTTFT